MAQNTSTAVMQRRHEAHDSLDDFPTPPWATRALCEWLLEQGINLSDLICSEPAANRGYMADPLAEYFDKVLASDIFDYGRGYEIFDYLFGFDPDPVDFTITNPPFRLAEQFIERMYRTSRVGFAVFVRSSFLEGQERQKGLFSQNPPTDILQFSERVVIHKGILRQAGSKYWDPNADKGKGAWRLASSATSYSWLFWNVKSKPNYTRFHWLPPNRLDLERPEDYPVIDQKAERVFEI